MTDALDQIIKVEESNSKDTFRFEQQVNGMSYKYQ